MPRAAKAPLRISKELFDLIQTSIDYSKLTRVPSTSPTPASGTCTTIRTMCVPTTRRLLQRCRKATTGISVWIRSPQTVFFDHEGVRIDFAVSARVTLWTAAIAVLQGLGVTRAMVNAGGDSRIIGDRFGKPWIIGIRDPDDGNRTILKIPLTDTAFSTSGDYERFFDEGGVRYHPHPGSRTGKSPHVVRSVTIIGPNATRTDALTKSVFVMGVKDALRSSTVCPTSMPWP
ncbi:MAG: FAD:protein FMN transferase [Steroidobacteraceae bacterium]